ncbi:hypothetical protein [Phytohabitans rumicis]|uniref:Uncharacterized protein n=1 Tax=Phytohabitans rumicis TaxID=1076125 RepID=A0A6V8L5E3_9ACTN|nr:hypothetical protein [Phytohabitans rumicis]GFJ92472.1 hypothetical protein Prum_061140 [Phytohabitans rumicis]
MLGRKALFWAAVGGVSLLTHFGLELVARKVPSKGLARFAEFIHCGPGNGGN